VLPNRLYIYDGGTVSRPYDGQTKEELLSYVQTRAYQQNMTFDESDMTRFIDFEGCLPIHYLIRQNSNELVDHLIQTRPECASYVMNDSQGKRDNALTFALENGNDNIAKSIIKPKILEDILEVNDREINLQPYLVALQHNEIAGLLNADPTLKAYLDK